jgi:hypothetical protein
MAYPADVKTDNQKQAFIIDLAIKMAGAGQFDSSDDIIARLQNLYPKPGRFLSDERREQLDGLCAGAKQGK